jgi:hypothetical protein
MKDLSFIKFIAFIFIGFLLNSCDKPAPTELVQDEDPLEVEVITKDADDEFYSSGYDTTGLVYEPSGYENIISISGVKISSRGTTRNSSIAQAIFFDRSMPVYSHGMLLGFRTRLLGNVEFNGVLARQVPLSIRFGHSDTRGDTLLGFMHLLYNRSGDSDDNFNYDYHSFVEFKLNPLIGRSINFNILTPPEITGTIHLEGARGDNDLKGILRWNAEHFDNFEIILGASEKGKESIFPLFRIKTKDDGNLEIPAELLNRIPIDRFDRLVFSLIRRIEYSQVSSENNLYVLSQSIHSLVVVIP